MQRMVPIMSRDGAPWRPHAQRYFFFFFFFFFFGVSSALGFGGGSSALTAGAAIFLKLAPPPGASNASDSCSAIIDHSLPLFSNTVNRRNGIGSSSSVNCTTGAVTHAIWPSGVVAAVMSPAAAWRMLTLVRFFHSDATSFLPFVTSPAAGPITTASLRFDR